MIKFTEYFLAIEYQILKLITKIEDYFMLISLQKHVWMYDLSHYRLDLKNFIANYNRENRLIFYLQIENFTKKFCSILLGCKKDLL